MTINLISAQARHQAREANANHPREQRTKERQRTKKEYQFNAEKTQ